MFTGKFRRRSHGIGVYCGLIPRLAATRPNAKLSPGTPLTPFGQKAADARDLGLAYAIVAVREQNAIYRERAFELLKQAIATTPNDPQALSYLADLYKKHSDDGNAIPLYDFLRQHRIRLD